MVVVSEETVLCRRGIIHNPNNIYNNIRDKIWIIGCIDKTNNKNFMCEEY